MNKESLTSLSFIIELLNPPMKHQNINIHKLFLEFKDIYTNCNKVTDTITELSRINKDNQEINKLIIQNNKIVVMNNFTTNTVESFWKRASYVIEKTVFCLNIPLFFFRQYTLRFTASPLKEKDSRIFLGNVVCGLDDNNLKPFSRPIHGFGLRIVLPPIPNEQNEYSIRIESLLSETSKIFLENQARFLTPLQLREEYLDNIKTEINKTDKFLKNNVCSFLEQYNK